MLLQSSREKVPGEIEEDEAGKGLEDVVDLAPVRDLVVREVQLLDVRGGEPGEVQLSHPADLVVHQGDQAGQLPLLPVGGAGDGDDDDKVIFLVLRLILAVSVLNTGCDGYHGWEVVSC